MYLSETEQRIKKGQKGVKGTRFYSTQFRPKVTAVLSKSYQSFSNALNLLLLVKVWLDSRKREEMNLLRLWW